MAALAGVEPADVPGATALLANPLIPALAASMMCCCCWALRALKAGERITAA
eukprot:CAMPEP_0202917294 /NCGR_PEP_ID=MMETSP1392-20130828/70678_1 /ASSEMBLY_ACC=CAM_ASM_000868 /TAXON_ID=225041 /ORGANISM="Chlamydomonas chlamydogama, Strain SAG 11-48b" /LENGTH=51 /DNA_ID=CAMNT_0049609999 /DNA_START=121 /DNA_END=273 /DNA_ORIENTATION=-